MRAMFTASRGPANGAYTTSRSARMLRLNPLSNVTQTWSSGAMPMREASANSCLR